MKKVNFILAIILPAAMAGCGGGKQSSADGLITVDVTKSYPKKELILQDFMDVEYIALETNKEFLCQGKIEDIGKDIILARNWNNDGDIFVYDRKGKGLRKINRKGQSGEEYLYCSHVVLDEDAGEIFVSDAPRKCIRVYDLYGTFKRGFGNGDGPRYGDVRNFDKENLICWYNKPEKRPTFYIVSKQDGYNTKEITIPFEQWKSTDIITSQDLKTNAVYTLSHPFSFTAQITRYKDQFILAEPSSDTVYRCLPDHSTVPFLVRTPSIQSMNPEIFIFPGILTDSYFFMLVYTKDAAPDKDLMYDRQTKTLFEYVVYNDDYSSKNRVYMMGKTMNDEIVFCQKLEAEDLVEAYEKGQLKGRLKEIAATLEEESNPVIMLVKHKKQ